MLWAAVPSLPASSGWRGPGLSDGGTVDIRALDQDFRRFRLLEESALRIPWWDGVRMCPGKSGHGQCQLGSLLEIRNSAFLLVLIIKLLNSYSVLIVLDY